MNKTILKKKETNGGHRGTFVPEKAHTVLFGFNPPFSSIFLNSEGNRSGTRKGIKFWIERLIINSAELSFREIQFRIQQEEENVKRELRGR